MSVNFIEIRFRITRALRQITRSTFISFLGNDALQTLVTTITSIYYLCLDVWGDDWDIIAKHKEFHETTFLILIVITLISSLIKAIVSRVINKEKDDFISFLRSYSLMTSKLVRTKLQKIKKTIHNIQNNNLFKKISAPEEQINLILNEFEHIVIDYLKLERDQFALTIICGKENKWFYEFETTQNWKRTKAEFLLAQNSAAKKCLDTGEPIFFPSKKLAESRGAYFMSDRDKNYDTLGSAFCYPITFKVNKTEIVYVVSLITYGVELCSATDQKAIDTHKLIFSDICLRLELELTYNQLLKSIN